MAKKEYRVTATVGGKRTITDCGLFKTKREAKAYADATKTHRKGSRPRVVHRETSKCNN